MSVMRSSRAAGLLILATAVVTAAACASSSHRAIAPSPVSTTLRPTSDVTTADHPLKRSVVIGFSVLRRPVVATEIGDFDSPAKTLIVGCIHGNEQAGIAIARALGSLAPTAEADIWIIPDLNPDGVAANTRVNADGVDLNRNFPYHWKPLGQPGSTFYSGSHPLSEPESTLTTQLVEAIRPKLTIYYHQHLDAIDTSEGPTGIEARYAAISGIPLRSLADYPGSAVGWQDALLGPTAFVVELGLGELDPAQVQRHLSALMNVLPRA